MPAAGKRLFSIETSFQSRSLIDTHSASLHKVVFGPWGRPLPLPLVINEADLQVLLVCHNPIFLCWTCEQAWYFFLEWVQSQSWSQTWPVWFLHLELASELLLIFRPTIIQSPTTPLPKHLKAQLGPLWMKKNVCHKKWSLPVCLSSPVNKNI